MMNDYYVYILFDQFGVPRYVGKGRGNRIDDHERVTAKHNRAKRAVIRRTISALGEIPKAKVCEGLSEPNAFATEVALIAAIGRLDLKTGPLTNMSAGGTGGDYGHIIKRVKSKWTAEQRAAVARSYSQARIREWEAMSPEERQRRISIHRSALKDGAARARAADPNYDKKRHEHIRSAHAMRTPEQKAEAARLALLTDPPELRSERARRFHASQTPEERSRRVVGSLTAAQLSERAKRAQASLSAEQRSDRTRRAQANLTPEKMAARARRAQVLGAGTRWITNGVQSKRISPDAELPTGWRYGKVHTVRRSLEK